MNSGSQVTGMLTISFQRESDKAMHRVTLPPFYYCHHPFPSSYRTHAMIKTCHFPSINYPSVDCSSIAYVNINYCSVDDAWYLGLFMALEGMITLMQ